MKSNMDILFYLKNRLRRYIFPTEELMGLLASYMPRRAVRILDVGCGSGWFLRRLLEVAPVGSSGTGVEVNPRYLSTGVLPNGNHFSIQEPGSLEEGQTFDFILFNDVLHHVHDKKTFLLNYLQRLVPQGYVFIKDMANDHFICTLWNRLHDKILSGDAIREITYTEILDILPAGFYNLALRRKRIFLYDHYWCIFRKDSSHH